MVGNDRLAREYNKLLQRHGVTARREHWRNTPEDRAWFTGLYNELSTAGVARTYLDEHFTVSARREGEDVGLGRILQKTAAAVEEVLALAEIELPSEVYAAEFPHGSFNAQACLVPGGCLILVNTGLMMFLYEAGKIISKGIKNVRRVDGAGRLLEAEQKPAWTNHEEEAALGEIVYSYLFRQDGHSMPRHGFPDVGRLEISMWLNHAAMVFAVAHEYGHLVARHLDGRSAGKGSREWIEKTRAQEMEADHIAALLLIKSNQQEPPNVPGISAEMTPRGPFKLPEFIVSSGPMFFFALDRLITRVGREVAAVPDEAVVSDHPPSETRAAALCDLFEHINGVGSMHLADSITSTIASREDAVVRYVRDKIESGRWENNRSTRERQ